jgi:uncharacterized protein (TIGR03118 family)
MSQADPQKETIVMITASWLKSLGRPSCKSRVTRHRCGGSAANRPRRRATFESLEHRCFLASGLSASLVADIIPGELSASPKNLTNVNGTLYFGAWVNSKQGLTRGFYKSDGTAHGTVLINGNLPGFPDNITPFGQSVLFSFADDRANGLWLSNGTSAGTALLNKSVLASDLTVVGSKVFFAGDDSKNGKELWVTDGTSAGTHLVTDLYPGTTTVYVNGDPGSRYRRVTLVNSSFPSSLTNINGTLYFTANDGIHGTELWKSDGTANGTQLVADIVPGPNGSFPTGLTAGNGEIIFAVGSAVWKSDGTAAGTRMIKQFDTSFVPAPFTNVNGTLYFPAVDGTGLGLWKTDGTAAGTVLVKPLVGATDLTNVNGTLYFAGSDGTGLVELWKSDGTIAGTVRVSAPFTAGPDWLTNVNGLLYFSADDGIHGTELWQSDGTSAGTVMVQDINPGPASSEPAFLSAMDNKLYFAATDSIHGTELWDPPPVQNNSYEQVNLTQFQPGMGRFTDPNLNGWGMDHTPNGPFAVANTSTGTITFYDAQGRPLPTVVTVPAAPGQPVFPIGSPTGLVYNPTSDFVISANGKSAPATFLVDTLDGLICGWNPAVDPNHAIVVVDNSAEAPFAASYTGLTIGRNDRGQSVLYAADSGGGPDISNDRIDVLDGQFRTRGSISDPGVAKQFPGNTVFQVENEDGKLFVTYAGFSAPFGGVVDVFDMDGHLLTSNHFSANAPGQGPLENPWGIVQAPARFGQFSNDLLIGNVEGGGNINVFDPKTGKYLGQLKRPDGTPVAITGLWDLEFGGGKLLNGRKDDLYFNAGFTAAEPAGNGLFGVIRAANDGREVGPPQDPGIDCTIDNHLGERVTGQSDQSGAQPIMPFSSTQGLNAEVRAMAFSEWLSDYNALPRRSVRTSLYWRWQQALPRGSNVACKSHALEVPFRDALFASLADSDM